MRLVATTFFLLLSISASFSATQVEVDQWLSLASRTTSPIVKCRALIKASTALRGSDLKVTSVSFLTTPTESEIRNLARLRWVDVATSSDIEIDKWVYSRVTRISRRASGRRAAVLTVSKKNFSESLRDRRSIDWLSVTTSSQRLALYINLRYSKSGNERLELYRASYAQDPFETKYFEMQALFSQDMDWQSCLVVAEDLIDNGIVPEEYVAMNNMYCYVYAMRCASQMQNKSKMIQYAILLLNSEIILSGKWASEAKRILKEASKL